MMKRRIAVYGLSFILLLSFVVLIVEVVPPSCASNIIYVDDEPGVGPGNPAENYMSIQDAIDNASAGDTVFVYNGTYYENVVINKSLNLSGEDKETVIINGGGSGDVIFISANNVNILGFTITGSGSKFNPTDSGIELNSVYNCNVSHNNVSNNNYGITISYSHTNMIIYNNVSNNYYGIILTYSNESKIYGNLAYKNKFGIYLSHTHRNNINNNTVSFNDIDGIVIASSSNNNITYNNAYFNDGDGISSDYSSGNNISYNNITYNHSGITIEYLGFSNVTGNIISSNIFAGISLGGTYFNILKENKLKENGIYVFGLQIDGWNTHTIDSSNIVNGKPIYYLKNQIGGIVPPGAGQVILANCANIDIENQELSHCGIGISLGFSSNINITANNVTSNSRWGLFLYESDWNRIDNNELSSCWSGARLWYCHNNIIINNSVYMMEYSGIEIESSYTNNITRNNFINNMIGIKSTWELLNNQIWHNNFIGNLNQAIDGSDNGNKWDIGYPLGGNFWSDYDGFDNLSGPAQNKSGSDGIGDTNYSLDVNAVDNYPLMQPIGNCTYLYEGWNLISIPFIQSKTDLGEVLFPISGAFDAVQWYNAGDQADYWKHNNTSKPSHLNDLTGIQHTIGFWIHITEPGGVLFNYQGSQPTSNQTIQLYKGWNMVGYPSLTSRNRTIALNNLNFGTEVDAVWSFNAAIQKWGEMGELDYFFLGKGYWIHATQNCIWDVPL